MNPNIGTPKNLSLYLVGLRAAGLKLDNATVVKIWNVFEAIERDPDGVGLKEIAEIVTYVNSLESRDAYKNTAHEKPSS